MQPHAAPEVGANLRTVVRRRLLDRPTEGLGRTAGQKLRKILKGVNTAGGRVVNFFVVLPFFEFAAELKRVLSALVVNVVREITGRVADPTRCERKRRDAAAECLHSASHVDGRNLRETALRVHGASDSRIAQG